MICDNKDCEGKYNDADLRKVTKRKKFGGNKVLWCSNCIKRDADMIGEDVITEARETAIKVIQEFEELLDRYEIDIPDDDREGHPSESRIYGSNYYDLEDKITEILEKFQLEN